jgi:hypothetical protein
VTAGIAVRFAIVADMAGKPFFFEIEPNQIGDVGFIFNN